MNSNTLYIYGAGGLGREVLSLVNAIGGYDIKGFIDDGRKQGELIKGLPVVGGLEAIPSLGNINVVLALGDPALKMRIQSQLPSNVKYPILIHPGAILQDISSIHIGQGSIITAGVIITTDVNIGSHVLINLNTTIGHDTRIGSCSSIMPGVNIAGGVTIGEGTLIGSGACIRNNITIGKNAIVGMSAAVITDVRQGTMVVGVPAKER